MMASRAPGALVVLVCLSLSSCGGLGGSTSGPQDYEEYECPAPIGKIVREDCSRQALKYEGASFQGSVGVGQLGASGAFREQAIREADGLVQMLKEQRVALCNDFNTCKVSVAEYRSDRAVIDDSFVALLALKDKMAALDARGAAFLLEEITKIRTGRSVAATPAGVAPTPATAHVAVAAGGPAPAQAVAVLPGASGLAGSYQIRSSANPGGGGSYAGTVSLTPRGSTFDVYWNIRGGTPYKGVGVVVGNVLCVGWSTTQAEKIGVAAYREGGARLDGAWTMTSMGGQIGTEILEGPTGLSGSYRIAEGRFGSAPPYGGTVGITPSGSAWHVHWTVGGEETDGVGIRVADIFAVGYGLPGQKDVGIVAYEIQGSNLVGKWASLGGSQLGLETLSKQ